MLYTFEDNLNLIKQNTRDSLLIESTFTPQQWNEIIEAFAANTAITSITGRLFNQSELEKFSLLLKNPNVREFSIVQSTMQNKMHFISEALQNNSTVKSIMFNACQFSEDDLFDIASILKTDLHLEELTITSPFLQIQIKDQNAWAFIEAMQNNHNVRHLNLRNQELNSEMLAAWIKILENNKTLNLIMLGDASKCDIKVKNAFIDLLKSPEFFCKVDINLGEHDLNNTVNELDSANTTAHELLQDLENNKLDTALEKIGKKYTKTCVFRRFDGTPIYEISEGIQYSHLGLKLGTYLEHQFQQKLDPKYLEQAIRVYQAVRVDDPEYFDACRRIAGILQDLKANQPDKLDAETRKNNADYYDNESLRYLFMGLEKAKNIENQHYVDLLYNALRGLKGNSITTPEFVKNVACNLETLVFVAQKERDVRDENNNLKQEITLIKKEKSVLTKQNELNTALIQNLKEEKQTQQLEIERLKQELKEMQQNQQPEISRLKLF